MSGASLVLPRLYDRQTLSGFMGLIGLGAALVTLALYALVMVESGMRRDDSALGTTALLFIPYSTEALTERPVLLAELASGLSDDPAVTGAELIPRDEQAAALNRLLGQPGVELAADELPLADVIRVKLNAWSQADLKRVSATAKQRADQATLVDFGTDRASLRQVGTLARLALLGIASAVLLLWVWGTVLTLRLSLLSNRQVWRTLLLVGATPNFVRRRFSRDLWHTALAAGALGLMTAALAIVVLRLLAAGLAQQSLLLGWLTAAPSGFGWVGVVFALLLALVVGPFVVWVTAQRILARHLS